MKWQLRTQLDATDVATDTKEGEGFKVIIPTQPSSTWDSAQVEDRVMEAFDAMVDSTEFWQSVDRGIASIPLFGDAQVRIQRHEHQQDAFELELTASLSSASSSASSPAAPADSQPPLSIRDFRWICAKLHECRAMFGDVLDMSVLDDLMITHQQSAQSQFAGTDAAHAKLSGSPVIDEIFACNVNALQELKTNGYTVIDTNLLASEESHHRLSQLLQIKSSQDATIRTDTIKFLDRTMATDCGLQQQHDVLMGLASYLNEYYFGHDQALQEAWPFPPRLPATTERPLTNPKFIQAAEYNANEFYVAHRDNVYLDDTQQQRRLRPRRRSNLRYITCILYCNDNWTKKDGGALRLYPNTTTHPMTNINTDELEHVDVLPCNGRLLIFESMLLHSVEKVKHPTKKRLALTCWINRPDESSLDFADTAGSGSDSN